ncbi:MAG: choice-of-anchor tandem repeat GloVer-containing protein [Candidatus Sulfotelmatobacter sp.]
MKPSLLHFALPALLFTALAFSNPATAQTETILYNFGASPTDGANPAAGLVFDSSGNLYGTTFNGGANDTGTIYELPTTGGEDILADCPAVGANAPLNPNSALVFSSGGGIYGTSASGGLYDTNYGGTDFALMRVNGGYQLKRISSDLFGGENDIGTPTGVIFDNAGNLWGTGLSSGDSAGFVYELEKNGGAWNRLDRVAFPKTKTLRDVFPNSGLIFDAAGNLYGTTMTGGRALKGSVYELPAPNYALSTLASFNGANGNAPTAGVILDSLGNLYGTTSAGGYFSKGNVFELSPNGNGGWSETILFSFNGANGQAPGALTFDSQGNLYGTTVTGGTYNAGVMFELSPGATWTETVLHNFGGAGDGATPVGALIFDFLGNLYGATSAGGANGVGIVYEITP